MTARTARIAGAFYLVIIAGGIFAQVAREQVLVFRDPAATARNILAQEFLLRAGFAAGVVILMASIALLALLDALFRPVSPTAARAMVFFNLVSISIEGANLLNHFAPIVVLGGTAYLTEAQAQQLQPLAYMALRLQAAGYNTSLAFFGIFCLLIGYLIVRSTFLPRFSGALMALAGACHLTNSFTYFLAPAMVDLMYPYILVPCFIGESALALWLAIKGINTARAYTDTVPAALP